LQRLEVPGAIAETAQRAVATELVLAFPQSSQASNCHVYSYLPVRGTTIFEIRSFEPFFCQMSKSGFNFIIQGDFDLISNRQAVHYSKPWNRFLRDQIPGMFVDAIQQTPQLRDQLFLYLPSETDVPEQFWKEVVRSIRDLLQSEACILTESGTYRKPSEVWLKPSGFDLFSNDELKAATGKEFIASSIDASKARRYLFLRNYVCLYLLATDFVALSCRWKRS
jgi:hypothetical protein